MKRFQTLTALFLLMFFTKSIYAQSQKDTVVHSIKLDTLVYKPNAKPVFERDTLNGKVQERTSTNLKGDSDSMNIMTLSTVDDIGKTSVNLDVSPSGAALATIPISIPPGVNGFTPEVSLAYNSQSGNGVAGYGWAIGGLSSISRIPATSFHSGRVSAVNLNNNDYFALDGQRLMLKSGTYGHPGAEYQTEHYSNLRIFSRGVTSIGGSSGPEYFEVLYPDGSKAFYGNLNSSRTLQEYGISYRESNLGAKIEYFYSAANNVLKLLQIRYGALGTNAGMNTINFAYQTSLRPEQSYVAGYNFHRDFILEKISVSVNGNSLRHYNLQIGMPMIGYQRLNGLVETNGDETRSLGTVYFSYTSTGDVIYNRTVSNLSLWGIASNNSDAIFGDFTGNGSMDFILRPTAKNKFWTFFDLEPGYPYMQFGEEINTGYHKEIFPIKWLTHNTKMLSGDGFAVVKDLYGSYKFEVLSRGISAPVYFQYDRIWEAPRAWGYYSECDGMFHEGPVVDQEFISGDFNGDGLTDIIALNRPKSNLIISQRLIEPNPWDPPVNPWEPVPVYVEPIETGCVTDYGNYNISYAHFINLDRRITSNFVTSVGPLYKSYTIGDKLLTGDFNGDGKTDILHIASGVMYVYSLNQTNNYLELLWQHSDSQISLSETILLGDYNGDGKTDLMFSTTTSYQHALFMSRGNGFKKHSQALPPLFGKTSQYYWYDGSASEFVQNSNFLMALDLNGDGKTDIAQVIAITRDYSSTGTIILRKLNNMSYTEGGGITFQHNSGLDMQRLANVRHNPIPVALTLDRVNHNLEIGFLSDNSLSLFQFSADMQAAKQLTSIWNNYETYDIDYSKLMSSSGLYHDIPLYESNYSQTFPNVDCENAPGFSVVSKITRAFNNTNHLQQVFGYRGAVSNTEGLGFLGFEKFIRSNWHVDSGDPNRMFDMSISDPQLRGAAIKKFTLRYPYLNPTILSAPLSSDGATINDYIARSDIGYQTQQLPNKVFVNTVLSSSKKDLLTGVVSQTVNEYDSYFNITKSTSNVNNLAITVNESTYENNNSGYFIGRPLTHKSTITVGSDSHTTEEEYTYTGYLPTQIKRKGNGTPWTTESITYDGFGNVTQKSIATSSGTRVASATYDITGRFALSRTDEGGKTNTSTYDAVTGNVLQTTNHYGQSTSYIYDTWGRLIETTNHLGKKIYNSYSTYNNGYLFSQNDEEGRWKSTYTNRLGQVLETQVKSLTGSIVSTAFEYDIYGRAYRVSQPGTSGSLNQWNETEFDEYGRIKKTTAYTGKVTNYSYSGLSTTVNDGSKSTTTTRNALQQIVSQQDPGGVINYSYYAHGGLKSANYDGAVQNIEYDGWGRKTKLIDPSAGVYEYAYNGFGEITQETTPKGVKNYNYDNATGRLIGKILTGGTSNTVYTYSYNNTTKLLESLSLTNADGNNAVYTYTYDANKRLSSTIEDNLHAKFTKSYTFDSFGRIATEVYEAKDKASNITALRTIGFTYQNGEVLQVTDLASGQIISKTNTLKSNGQMASEFQGTNLKTTYNYDTFNLPQSTVTERIGTNPANLMTLNYNFDAQKGTLNSRGNSAIGWNEIFYYDNLSRLTDFNDNNSNNSQTYDGRGRINNNSQLGNYGYSGVSYQQSELTNPTTAAANWYHNRNLQQITYNSFKKPLNINEQGIEQIDFQYNAQFQRAHMYYGSTDSDKDLRPIRRHYSEDGSMEITREISTGKTSFVFYLGGDSYNAPAIYNEVHSGSGTIQNLYYLHRDQIGSIILITDVDGNAVEKRQFDAWGNVVALTDGNGNPLTNFLITDRGFTGHEHLLGVGLINMNGRLYDPRLHRFLSPDNYIQDPFGTQNFNRYAYAMNNPLMYTDPSGEILIPVIIGALLGAYAGGTMANNGELNPLKWDYSSGKTWGYMLGGAVVGGVAGWAGGTIATSGMPYANTMGILSASYINSVGTFMYTGGQTDVSVNFGFGSYNFSTGEFGFIGKKGNSVLENIGYGLGALANVQDISAGFKGGSVEVKARKKLAGHSWIEGDDVNISVGPGADRKPELDGVKWESQYVLRTVKGRNFVTQYVADETFSTTLNNVNVGKLQRMTSLLNSGLSLSGEDSLLYGVWNGCVNQTARALFMSGVLNVNALLPITAPVLLNAELALRNYGMMFSYYMKSNK